MRILLTNDDGIGSNGIQTLVRALSPSHEVWVVAPETEKSGGSHSITLRDALRVRTVGEKQLSCRGTPADCVLVALLGLVPRGFDLVISGINHGPNLGTDILYSGTAAGARQGALMGVPSVALSVGTYTEPFPFDAAADFAARNLDIFRALGTDDHFLNINFPAAATREAQTVITFPSRRIYRDELSTYKAPNGDVYCFMGGELPDAHPEEGSDSMVVSQGRISISPIHAHPRNWASIEESYRGVQFR
ncbi:MAG: 5'/3'-nucleotidase SurE [Spirochaetia bacterium]|jgi:5'-nucleotidase